MEHVNIAEEDKQISAVGPVGLVSCSIMCFMYFILLRLLWIWFLTNLCLVFEVCLVAPQKMAIARPVIVYAEFRRPQRKHFWCDDAIHWTAAFHALFDVGLRFFYFGWQKMNTPSKASRYKAYKTLQDAWNRGGYVKKVDTARMPDFQ